MNKLHNVKKFQRNRSHYRNINLEFVKNSDGINKKYLITGNSALWAAFKRLYLGTMKGKF